MATPHPPSPEIPGPGPSGISPEDQQITGNRTERWNTLLPRLTNTQAILLSRISSGPFSCRMYGRKRNLTEHRTVLGVLMGKRHEEPILRYLSCEDYLMRLDLITQEIETAASEVIQRIQDIREESKSIVPLSRLQDIKLVLQNLPKKELTLKP